jgi:hypothetical protein
MFELPGRSRPGFRWASRARAASMVCGARGHPHEMP